MSAMNDLHQLAQESGPAYAGFSTASVLPRAWRESRCQDPPSVSPGRRFELDQLLGRGAPTARRWHVLRRGVAAARCRGRAASLLPHDLDSAPFEGMGAVFPSKAQADLPVHPGENYWIRAYGNLVPALPGGNGWATQPEDGGAKKRISILAFLAVSMPQAGTGSPMTPNHLPVASPSTVRLEPELGETTTARKGRPDGAAHSARRAGSNSQDSALQYGECRACPRTFLMRRGDVVPNHHSPHVSERGPHPICPGAREQPGSYLEV